MGLVLRESALFGQKVAVGRKNVAIFLRLLPGKMGTLESS